MPSFFVTGSTLGPELNSNRPTGNTQKTKITGDFPIDIAALLEAGAGYNFDRYALVASLIAQRSFRQLAKEPNETNMKLYGFGLSIGLRYKL